MKDSERLHGTLIFPYTELTHKIFLKEYNKIDFVMEKDGKVIDTAQISTKLRGLLEKQGYKFTRQNTARYNGKVRAFDCKIEVNKIIDDNQQVRQLNIKVPGKTMEEVRKNIRIIREGVKAIAHVEPETKLWDRLEDC